MKTNDFLFEIGTEELPPKSLKQLSAAFVKQLSTELQQSSLTFKEIKPIATPRRLGALITNLATQQPEQYIQRKGPTLEASYDKNGAPTPACLGFAKSCGVNVEALQKKQTDKGAWLFYEGQKSGLNAVELLPSIIKTVLKKLPVAKLMRWNNHTTEFIRPVHWVVMLLGKKVINTTILGLPVSNITYGHRFHYPKAITLKKPCAYFKKLKKPGFVIAEFSKRQALIEEQINKLVGKENKGIIEKELLDEVTGLVEWPVALIGEFDQRFLELPPEVLIIAMKVHQRYFPLANNDNQLSPRFITISNIDSKRPNQVITGNERVLRARLSDAEFFYKADCKKKLIDKVHQLKTVVFQNKLGSLYDKTQRLSASVKHIAPLVNVDIHHCQRAASLAKCDLMSDMVGEFPELQGIMGYYYSLHDGEPKEVASAIKEHYQPRFSGDNIPSTIIGCVLALADKLDTLVGILGINKIPTGEKDPFGLRRAALGILRIVIEKKLDLDLKTLLEIAVNNYQVNLPNQHLLTQSLDFLMERLRAWYLDQNIPANIINAVMACYPTNPSDFDRRINAVTAFQQYPEAEALAAANKRVNNILKKQKITAVEIKIDLLEKSAEIELAKQLQQHIDAIANKNGNLDYTNLLSNLASLQKPVDQFFDDVMVMTDDEKLRNNRLVLLNQLRQLFLKVADISLLQT